MAYEIERSDSEIDQLLNDVAAQLDKGGSKYPGMTYEAGIREMFEWIVGETDDNPMA